VYAFQLDVNFAYSRYDKIQNAVRQPSHTYNNYIPLLGLGFTASESLALDAEVEFAQTPHQSFGFRSSALQGRLLLLDDIAGDPVSITAGVDVRGVSGRSVKDVSSPYASYFNAQASLALGKEISWQDTWKMRAYGWGSVGLANHGAPWIDSYLAIEGNIQNTHRILVFSDGYFGLGHKQKVNIQHFRGWGAFAHRSIDVGIRYQYVFELWGALGFQYAYRVYAHSYPAKQQLFVLSYTLPFSLF
jgi:hypothetical protein